MATTTKPHSLRGGGAEEKPWPLAVYKAFPRLWTHWTKVLQSFSIKSISNVTAMHNSPQILISPRKLILCATANELSLLCNRTTGRVCRIHCLVVWVLCPYVKHVLCVFSLCHTLTHMKPKCHVSISAVCKSSWYSWLHSSEDICLQFNICLTVLSAGTVDNL